MLIYAGGDDRFEVDSESGIVRTKGGESLRNVEYELGVSAQDVSAQTLQKSPTHSLKVLVGERDPQFFETQYVANVPESATERYKCVSVVVRQLICCSVLLLPRLFHILVLTVVSKLVDSCKAFAVVV